MNLRIAIVEDEPLIAFHLKSLLLKLGHEVVFSVPNPEKTLLQLSEVQPDLIILDIQLHSNMNGIDLAREINRLYKIPFIFITAHADEQTMKSALSVKPLGYIFKPFSEKEIYATIEIIRQSMVMQQNNSEDLMISLPGTIGLQQIPLADITHVLSDKNYIEVYHKDGRIFRKKQTLQGFMNEMPVGHFIQIHRSHAVNPNYVNETSRTLIKIGDRILPIGRNYTEQMTRLIRQKSKDSH